MDLFVLRHAIAEDAGPGQADPDRRLTDEGRIKLRSVVRSAQAAGFAPRIALTSPYLRARQTTEVMMEELDGERDVIVTPHLTPYASIRDLWDELRDYGPMSPVVVVGHNPQLSELVSAVVGATRYGVEMKKAAIACVRDVGTGPQPMGRLTWLLTAKLAGA